MAGAGHDEQKELMMIFSSFELGAPFSLIGRRSADDSRAHRTITSLAVTPASTHPGTTQLARQGGHPFKLGSCQSPQKRQRSTLTSTSARSTSSSGASSRLRTLSRCNVKLVTAAQQLHGILDNTANNKVLECELRLYALQTILYDNITHVSPHVAPPPSLDIVAYRDPGTTSCTTSSHLNSNANITATRAAALRAP